jgi:tetratricopeptide (TPR) repeat protein
MKKILVTVVLGIATVAAAQTAAQPAQPSQGQSQAAQPSASTSQGPVIKDPAEYNAYVGAINQKDPAARISGLEAFLTQYPNSIMKVDALQTLMGDYQQTNNQAKTMDTATKLVAADPTNERAMALLAYFDRLKAQGGDANATQDLADAKKYSQMGLDGMAKFSKPQGMSDGDFQKLKDQMTGIFNAALGLAALTDKNYDDARKYLRAAVDATPDTQKDFSVVYPLALAYAGPRPPDPKLNPDPLDSIWFAARASIVAPTPQYQQQIEKYARDLYIKYHGGDDGWTDVLAQAKGSPTQPAGFAIKPAPSPADQAHTMAIAGDPTQMDFAQWEFILSNGAQADQDLVWNAIKGKSFKLQGTVITATATQLDIAASLDDIDAKHADITLTFETPLAKTRIPKEGTALEYFVGAPASYTPNPFMMTMEKGGLPPPKTAPKPPVHHKPTSN